MTSHTPRPWKWRSDGEPYLGGEDICITDATEDPDIAMVWAWFGGDGVRGPLSMQSQANARLIAAAPELYAALKTIMDRYQGAFGDNPPVLENCDLQAVAAAFAALARADGSAERQGEE
jgi:hypothetical protein